MPQDGSGGPAAAAVPHRRDGSLRWPAGTGAPGRPPARSRRRTLLEPALEFCCPRAAPGPSPPLSSPLASPAVSGPGPRGLAALRMPVLRCSSAPVGSFPALPDPPHSLEARAALQPCRLLCWKLNCCRAGADSARCRRRPLLLTVSRPSPSRRNVTARACSSGTLLVRRGGNECGGVFLFVLSFPALFNSQDSVLAQFRLNQVVSLFSGHNWLD